MAEKRRVGSVWRDDDSEGGCAEEGLPQEIWTQAGVRARPLGRICSAG